ncbi:hypothetical protein L484_007134 [Morus notabilis]|uniref:DUF2828 domain-containing protein n=1 Tax=Morus notabilis TaxID=981085 RepID=W9S2U3_9ROSA|nr:uncharacterized protein LOC21390541 [Morus notabilis]XP_024030011.1 uncharacterized protein LOC21390541 [Morus notabilis]EXC23526.1 hypothetical protein L484_007134 [Morus notabilis]
MLLGPLDARGRDHSAKPAVESPENDEIVNPTAMDSVTGKPPMGLTENLSPTFLSTGNPCLDFFFHVVPDTPPADLIQRLRLAWAHDSLTALKLVCNLRGVRGTGKSDKEGFYTASLWLHKTHPKTLALNARAFAHFGYLKDLPEILYRLLEGSETRKLAKEEWKNRKKRKLKIPNVNDKEKARALRKERELAKAKRALERYESDLDYRFLYDCVSDVFADMLKLDMQFLSSGEIHRISLASKWCPSIDSSYDKCTLICEGIARRVFPRESNSEYGEVEEAHYVYRIRDRLRKEVLVPLHKALELPEVYMSANQWGILPYNRVASVAMKNYKDLFSKHDSDRFGEYLENVKSGKAKIAAGALLPHEIIKSLEDEDGGKVAELQWQRMVEDVAKKGKLSNCIAVCDVSGSMDGVPMEVSVALGLLVSELSEEPWKGRVITFSENPQIHEIEGDTLLSKTEFVRRMEWGMNTNVQKVFDRILEIAIEGKLSEEQLIQRVFVFSDMEFDQACRIETMGSDEDESGEDSEEDKCEEESNEDESGKQSEEDKCEEVSKVDKSEEKNRSWETNYEVIQRKFREKGYNKVPEIVFWNLRNSSSTPVVAKQVGVALVSGFSKNLLSLFLEEGGIVNPQDVMALAISGQEYSKLQVYD